jgi:nucleotide-binding universal stress UspA family protein
MSRIIVGLADRPGMDRTLGWAVAEAAATGARLVIVRAEVRRPSILKAVACGFAPALEEADPLLARAIDVARTTLDDRVAVTAHRDSAGSVLVSSARTGDLVVLGAPTVSGWWGRGSTTYHVMTRAPCPVVAVHDPVMGTSDYGSGPSLSGHVVVGVDGSPAAANAGLAFGFTYANQHRMPVVAATATRHSVEDAWFDDQFLEAKVGSEPAEASKLAADVEPWHLKYPDVAVRRAVVCDDAVDGLRRVSRDAALLVIGTAADRMAPLGRVSRSLVEWSGCPVAVVRTAP